MKKNYKTLLSIIVLTVFIVGAVGSVAIDHDAIRERRSNTGNSSSSDCSLDFWVERSGGYYIPYFKKTGDCGLSLDYALYYTNGDFFADGHLYFTKISSSPSTGRYAKSPIKIVIKSKKWD